MREILKLKSVVALSFILSLSLVAEAKKSAKGTKAAPTSTKRAKPRSTGKFAHPNPQRSVKTFAVKTAPIALLAGWYTLDFSIRASTQFSIGPSLVVYDGDVETSGSFLSPNYKGYGAGFHWNYFLRNINENWFYLSGHTYFDDYKSLGHNSSFRESVEGIRTNLIFGWKHQFHGLPLIMQAGGGLEYRWYSVREVPRSSSITGVTRYFSEEWGLPMIEFKIGFEF